MEVEIGIGKSGRRAYGFDDIAIVPSRRTRDPEDVDISWEVDAYKFELPMMAAAMDGVVSPSSAIEIGRLGGLACLNLEGLWTRYVDPESIFDEIAALAPEKATRRMQELYAEPIKPELIGPRIREIKDAGVLACASLTPQRVEEYAKLVLDAELDMLVIQGTVVSAAMDKTIVVKVEVTKSHRKYKKVVRRSVKFHAHDEGNTANVGDVVRIVETRPLSATKRWRLTEIVEVAK